MKILSFQQIILNLQQYWQDYGCAILQPYDMEVGAGTFHPATVLRCLDNKPWNVAYVQPSRRPTDSRYGKHPNRMQHYYQFQTILKPSPDNIQELFLGSLKSLGISFTKHDIRFVEDDWESPTLGASGLGWEIWLDGMEIGQFTYMQQIGGIECRPIAGELTYGLERIALYLQGVEKAADIAWNDPNATTALTYGEIEFAAEEQCSKYNVELANVEMLKRHFIDYMQEAEKLAALELPIPAYEFCIKASHVFNLLCSRSVLSVTERAAYIAKVRHLAKISCQAWLKISK